MPSIFGYSLGSVGPEAGHSPVDTQGKPNPADIVMGDDIVTFMNVDSGTKLKNRSGDTWTFNNVFVYNNSSIYSNDNTAVIDGRTFNFSQELFLGIGYQSPPSINFIHGSYMFLANNENGNIVIGHPTRVFNDYMGLAPADSFYGIVEFVDNKPIWSFSDIVDVWTAFAVFCARELSFAPKETDPYEGLGDAGMGGGSISVPGFPVLTASSTGIIGLFAPSSSQMKALSDYMWTDFGGTGTDTTEVLKEIVEALKRTISNPLDYVIGLNIIPSQGLSIGEESVIKFGFTSSGVSMPRLLNQYFTVDCGSLSFPPLCGDTFLDYAPYSKFSIYLPYIGVKDVDANDFVGHTIGVIYHGDTVTGGVTAYITKDGSVMYQYSGCCALNIPLSADNWGNTISGAVQIATSLVAAGAIGGAAGVGIMAAKGAASVAANPSLLSPQVAHSGAVSGGAGCMAVQYPFVIREAVRFHSTAGFNKFSGYPAYYNRLLGDVSGFTTVIDVHLENVPATNVEIAEIENLLKSGVIL